MEPLQLCFLWYVVFVFSVVLHEYAHAFVGYLYGDHTAAHHGLATLNPVPHIQRSPIGMIIVPLLSFVGAGWMIGWASTPYDPYWAHANPKRAALMSLAGPAANLILVLIAGLLIHLGIAAGMFYPPESIGFTRVVEANSDGLAQGVAVLISILFTLNLVLLVFNLIPVPPLDGTAIGEFVFKGEMLYKYRQLMSHPNLRVFGIFIAWMVMSRIFGPIHTLALNALVHLARFVIRVISNSFIARMYLSWYTVRLDTQDSCLSCKSHLINLKGNRLWQKTQKIIRAH